MKRFNTDKAPAPIGPYSQSTIVDNIIYISGQIPLSPETGEIVGSTIEEQAKQVFDNVVAILNAAGSRAEQVIKTTLFIKDMNQFAAINMVYDQYFGKDKPARSCVEVARLPKDVGVEMECIARI